MPKEEFGEAIVLYQFAASPFCHKVRRCMHLKGVRYRIEEMTPRRLPIELRRLSPRGKLPVLVHGSRTVVDSTEICAYLEQRFPTPSIVPDDPRDRALDTVLEDWGDEVLYFFEMYLRFQVDENFPAVFAELSRPWSVFERQARPLVRRELLRRLRAQGFGRKPYEVMVKDYRRTVAAIDELVRDRSFLCGDRVSAADLSCASMASCIRPLPEGRVWEDFPRARAWLCRVDEATKWPPVA